MKLPNDKVVKINYKLYMTLIDSKSIVNQAKPVLFAELPLKNLLT